MKTVILEDPMEMSRVAVGVVSRVLNSRRAPVVAVPTGKTPVLMYQLLAEAQRSGELDLSRVLWFALDEFAGLPPEHPGSFRRWLVEHLFIPAGLDQERLQSLRGDAVDLVAEARAYESRIAAAGGLDLAILGLGLTGHLGFNEPGTPADSCTGIRKLSRRSRDANQYLFPDAEVPASALSMGLGTIMGAKEILLMASGSSKAKAVSKMLSPSSRPLTFPASILREHVNTTVLLDQSAAALAGEAGDLPEVIQDAGIMRQIL